MTNPQVVDFNNDGKLDLLLGERDGKVFLYEGSSNGLLTGVNLTANNQVIDTGYFSSPVLVDWNEDGYLDLLLGGSTSLSAGNSGFLHIYLNDKSNSNELNFTTHTVVMPSWNMYKTTQDVFDLDNDGDKDMILCNDNGQVYFAANIGTNSAPLFSGYSNIYADGRIIDVGLRARLSICDWDENGIADLVIGCKTREILVFLGSCVSVSGNEVAPLEYSFAVSESHSSGFLELILNTQIPGEVSVSIYDCSGRLITDYEWSLPAGNSNISCDIGSNPPGLYLLTANFGNRILSDRVILVK